MRARFLIAIVRENKDQPQPKDLCDFIVDWDTTPILIGIKFCPFCGKTIDSTQQLRT